MIFSGTRRAERWVTTGLRQVTPAAVGGTQAANCEAPERTSPTSAATASISDNLAGQCIFCIIWSFRRSVSEIKSGIYHKCTDAVKRVGAFSVLYGHRRCRRQEAELRPRIAQYLSGRVRPLPKPCQFTGSLSSAKADQQPSVSHRRT